LTDSGNEIVYQVLLDQHETDISRIKIQIGGLEKFSTFSSLPTLRDEIDKKNLIECEQGD
jgi:hypothetical protein